MATFSGINVSGTSNAEIVDALVALNRSLTYQMENLDSGNVTEVGGWIVGTTALASKAGNVGMSSDTSQPAFWAGSATPTSAPFRVNHDGSFVATNAQITGGTISWGAVGAPLYSDIQGTKPPANADNTDAVITAGGSNFTKVAGAYVYSGPANYSQIAGGPPVNADNTASALPSSLGINFTKIGSDYIYTGTLNANQINAGTINANYINGGTLSGITINVTTDLTVGNNIQIGAKTGTGSGDLKQVFWNGSSVISAEGSTMTISSDYLVIQASNLDFGTTPITGTSFVAKFG